LDTTPLPITSEAALPRLLGGPEGPLLEVRGLLLLLLVPDLAGLLDVGGVRVADNVENVVEIGRGCVLRRMVAIFLDN
jgi:hypothetical protein